MMILSPHDVFRRVDRLPLRAGDATAQSLTSGDGTLTYSFDGNTIHGAMTEQAINAHRASSTQGAYATMPGEPAISARCDRTDG